MCELNCLIFMIVQLETYLDLELTNQIQALLLIFFDFMGFQNIFINSQILSDISDIIICDLHD